MESYRVCILFLATFVLSASCLPVEVNREKRGVIMSALGGAALGAAAGALIPGVSAKQGAAAGAALGGGYSLLKGKKKDSNNVSSTNGDGIDTVTDKPKGFFSRLLSG